MKAYRIGAASAAVMALGLGAAALAQPAAGRADAHVAAAEGGRRRGVRRRIRSHLRRAAVPPATPRAPAPPRPPGPPPRESGTPSP